MFVGKAAAYQINVAFTFVNYKFKKFYNICPWPPFEPGSGCDVIGEEQRLGDTPAGNVIKLFSSVSYKFL
jgi:hypothetical protein